MIPVVSPERDGRVDDRDPDRHEGDDPDDDGAPADERVFAATGPRRHAAGVESLAEGAARHRDRGVAVDRDAHVDAEQPRGRAGEGDQQHPVVETGEFRRHPAEQPAGQCRDERGDERGQQSRLRALAQHGEGRPEDHAEAQRPQRDEPRLRRRNPAGSGRRGGEGGVRRTVPREPRLEPRTPVRRSAAAGGDSAGGWFSVTSSFQAAQATLQHGRTPRLLLWRMIRTLVRGVPWNRRGR